MLENAYLIVKIGVNTEENELNVAEILPIAGGVPRRWPRGPACVRGVVGRVCEGGPFPPSPEHSANGIPQTLDGPFSAVPEPICATKYVFTLQLFSPSPRLTHYFCTAPQYVFFSFLLFRAQQTSNLIIPKKTKKDVKERKDETKGRLGDIKPPNRRSSSILLQKHVLFRLLQVPA